LRLLGAAAFAALGFAAVWQGFGLAGFGTDAHALRVTAVGAVLFVCGLVLLWPGVKRPVRVVAAVLGLCVAGAWWWAVPHVNGYSLEGAAAERDHLKQQFATPLLDDSSRGKPAKERLESLEQQYPSLATGARNNFTIWVEVALNSIDKQYGDLSPTDVKGAVALRDRAAPVGELDPGAARRIEGWARAWVDHATKEETTELNTFPQADWPAFDRTAPRRKALADAFPEALPALVASEEQWVDLSVEFLIVKARIKQKPDDTFEPTRKTWTDFEKEVLALHSVDTKDGRFKAARQRLFDLAHVATQREVTALLEAGQYDRMFGLARKHAVEWDATARVLGPDAVAKLDAMRTACAMFAALAEKAAPSPDAIEVAPPPRTKP
jgi:hypothetical protein